MYSSSEMSSHQVYGHLILALAITGGASGRPRITAPKFRDIIYIGPDENAFLQCSAEANPAPRYTWYKDQNAVRTDGIYSVDPINGTLQVTHFTSREDGRYTCKAENEEGIDVSSTVTLIEARVASRWSVPEIEEVSGVGEPMTLRCREPPESHPPGIINWFKDETELKTSERIIIDLKGSLHFHYTLDDDAGTYKCGLYNPKLNLIKLGSLTKVHIDGKQKTTQAGPVLQYKSEDREAALGTKMEIECVFSGRPIPEVTWKHGGQSKKGRVLTISALSESDGGTYKCVGINVVGREETSIDITLVSGPLWVESPKSQVVLEGSDAIFWCKARSLGSAPVKVTWLYEWLPIDSPHFTEESNGAKLLLHNVTVDDCVQCNVSNKVDYIIKNACLRVVNDSNYMPTTVTPSTTTSTTEYTTSLPTVMKTSPTPASVGLKAGLVVVALAAVAAVVIFVVVIWRMRKKKESQYLTVLRVKPKDEDFEEKAKRRQTF